MLISDIKAKLDILKHRDTSSEKTWLLFVNIIKTFRKAVQMCVLPYTQVTHEKQMSKVVLSC